MPGLLDMLLGAQANTGPGSQSASQTASTLQAAAPFIGNGFSLGGMPANGLFTSGAQAQQPSFAALLQSLMSAKEPQPPSPYGPEGFGSPGYAPTPEQAARQAALAQTFPASRNVVDLRQTPQFYPRTLPQQQMTQGIQGALTANPYWPRPAQGPMQRYGPQ